MSRAAVHGWAAAVIGSGALLAASAGRGGVDAGRAVDLFWYVVLCGLVCRWGTAIYGPEAALGATALFAWSPEGLAGGAGMRTGMALAACAAAAVYTTAQCLWDPSIQLALLAGLATGAALLSGSVALALLPLALLLVVLRVVMSERMEPRRRVAHGAGVAVLIAWAVGLMVVAAAGSWKAARAPTSHGLHGNGAGTLLAHGPLMVLLLARRWRWERRYSDGTLILAGACLLLAAGLWGETPWLLVVPFAALLAGGAWDRGRSRRAQRAAWFLVGAQLVIALALSRRAG